MRRVPMCLMAIAAVCAAASGTTILHYNFEDGTPEAPMNNYPETQQNGTVGTADLSGNGYHMHAWDDYWGPMFSQLRQTPTGVGLSSMHDGHRDGYTLADGIRLWSPSAWTIELSFKLDNISGWRTLIGRDGAAQYNGQNIDPGAAFYIQKNGDNGAIRVNFATVSGERIWVDSSLVPAQGKWYHFAVVVDGDRIDMYADYLDGNGFENAGTHMLAPGVNHALLATGNWTFGRGWYGGNFVDHISGNLDDIRLSDVPLAPDQFLHSLYAHQPDPAQNAASVPTSQSTLSWRNRDGVNVCEVYFGRNTSEPNALSYKSVLTLVETIQNPPQQCTIGIPEALAEGDVCYWVVESYRGISPPAEPNLPGIIWTFTAHDLIPPVIRSQPSDAAAPEGQNAVFKITAEDITGGIVEYQWFRVVADGDDIAMTERGPENDTLIIPGVQISDQGYYYCRVSNDAGFVDSRAARLVIQFGLIHRYSFTNDPNDSVGGAHGVLVNRTGNARYENGQVVLGNWWHWSNDNNGDYVDLPNGLISALGPQATFEIWATTTVSNANWSRIFDFGISDGGEDASPSGGGTAFVFLTSRGDDGGRLVPLLEYVRPSPREPRRIVDPINHWMQHGRQVYYAVVWDEIANKVRLYEDGRLVGENDLHFKLAALNDVNNWLGRSQWNDPLFMGSYNEFRIWDIALTGDAILAHLQAGPGVPEPADACLDRPEADLNGDCRVDLEDLAVMSLQWLTSGLVSIHGI
jgi:hypothetical protein